MGDKSSMLALTLQTPWPFAFAELGKDIENRPWKPSPKQILPDEQFALHGGKRPSSKVQGMRLAHFFRELERCPERVQRSGWQYRHIEGIFAVGTYGGTVTESDSPWFVGPYGWWIKNLIVFPEPVRCTGAQGLWKIPEPVLSSLRDQLRPMKEVVRG